MSIHSVANTPREVWLIAAGAARGNRNALIRAARSEQRPSIRKVLASSARDFNRDMLQYIGRARSFV
jgi:hypothetical protein